jgi:hypothetical protein
MLPKSRFHRRPTLDSLCEKALRNAKDGTDLLPVKSARERKPLTERKIRLPKWINCDEISLLEESEESAHDGYFPPDRVVRELPRILEFAYKAVKDLRRNHRRLVDTVLFKKAVELFEIGRIGCKSPICEVLFQFTCIQKKLNRFT